MTDSTGVIQHATYSIPNFHEGYCLDDNARALVLTVCWKSSGTIRSKSIGRQRLTRRF